MNDLHADNEDGKEGIRAGGHWIELTHTDRVIYDRDGITKQDIIDYYYRMSGLVVRYTKDRPLMMQRLGWRDGSIDKVFVQQRPSAYFPKWIRVETFEMKDSNETIDHVLCNDAASLIYLVNQGMITPHVWASRFDRPDHPDQVVFDLDPGSGGFDIVRKTARAVKEALERRGLMAFVMTTGSKGLHVRTPILRRHTFDEVRDYARQIADEVASASSTTVTTEMRKDKRRGRLLIDVMRNAYGQNSVVPYALRARAGAPVALPVGWDELDAIKSDTFSLRNIRKRIEDRGDIWSGFFGHARKLRL
ncbi:MAG: non-homologous end-joining DNA ligase [Rhodothermales bacterium]